MNIIIEFIISLLAPLGDVGNFLVIVITYIIDAFAIPVLPDIVYNFIFMTNPTLEWGIIIAFAVVIGENTGMLILYYIAENMKLPHRIQRVMKAWGDFLIVHDERMLLIQRVAPMLMFTGAFVSVLDNWRLSRALFWNSVGCLTKYILLSILYFHFFQTLSIEEAQRFSLILTVGLMALCLALSFLKKMKDGWDPKETYHKYKDKLLKKNRN